MERRWNLYVWLYVWYVWTYRCKYMQMYKFSLSSLGLHPPFGPLAKKGRKGSSAFAMRENDNDEDVDARMTTTTTMDVVVSVDVTPLLGQSMNFPSVTN